MNKQKKKKSFLNLALLFIFSFGVIFLLIRKDFKSIVSALANAQWVFVVLAIAFQALTPIIEGLMMMILGRRYRKDYTFKEGAVNSSVGLFFCFITPSATGGQFAQAYVFDKQGIKVEQSASLLIVNFIAYQIVNILYCTATLIFSFNRVSTLLGKVNVFGLDITFLVLVIIGFVINVLCIVGILFLAYSNFANKIVKLCVRILAKLKIVKSVEYRTGVIDNKINAFRKNLSDIKSYWQRFIGVCLLTVVKQTIYFMIPFLVALALGVTVSLSDFFLMIALASYVMLIATFIPIPGASGGTEFFFFVLFAVIFVDNSILSAAMIMWRTITFYIPLIYTGITAFFFNKDRQVNVLESIPLQHKWFFYRGLTNDILDVEAYFNNLEKESEDDDSY